MMASMATQRAMTFPELNEIGDFYVNEVLNEH